MPPLVQHLGIIGVGLIGGSIGAAARKRGLAEKITGLGRSAAKLHGAIESSIIDSATEDFADLADCDLVIVATPVNRIVDDVLSLANCCSRQTVVTDAGSVKEVICSRIPSDLGIRFIGSHPLAGSEKSGFIHANAELFRGRVCVLTPDSDTDSAAIDLLRRFWMSLGMVVLKMSPAEHDRRLARTSHLPHLAAAALTSLLQDGDRPLAATGFRDTTRIAAGDPELWRAIFEANAAAVVQETDRLIQLLSRWRDQMTRNDWESLTRELGAAKLARESIRD
jgi:prephenate dehydrogenase